MRAKTTFEVERAAAATQTWARLSDKLLGFGPFSIGLNGVLGFVPLGGTLYSGLAGLAMLVLALRARASAAAWLLMLFYLAADFVLSAPVMFGLEPFGVADAIWRGQAMAAGVLRKDLERTHFVSGRDVPSLHAAHVEEMRKLGKKRLVYLG